MRICIVDCSNKKQGNFEILDNVDRGSSLRMGFNWRITMNEDLASLTNEALKRMITFKKNRLHSLKSTGWFGEGPNNRISQLECQRRRNDIKRLIEELNRRGDNG